MKEVLNPARNRLIPTGCHDRCGNAARHFQGQGGPRQRSNLKIRSHRIQNAGHGQARGEFDAFGHADHSPPESYQPSRSFTKRLGRYGNDHHVSVDPRCFEIRLKGPVCRQGNPRQEPFIDPGLGQFGHVLAAMPPDTDLMSILGEHQTQRRPPRTRSQDGHLHDAESLDFPKRCSVPAFNRSILAR